MSVHLCANESKFMRVSIFMREFQ